MTKNSSHPHSFRQEEVDTLFQHMHASESVSIIGMSGTGKSNLFNHICNPETQSRYAETHEGVPLILRVNFHYAPDFSDRSLYSLILEQIEDLEGGPAEEMGIPQKVMEQVAFYHDALIDAGDDLLRVQRQFKRAIRRVMVNSRRKMVLLFDQFDEIYQEAEPRFFANLRGLRESYKYRLSFIIFTRDLLPNLAPSDAAREEFYELLAPNVMALRPYNKRDALSLLNRIGKRNNLELTDRQRERLIDWTGGHAGLLRAALLAVGRQQVTLSRQRASTLTALLSVPSIKLECEKVWGSLNGQEQKLVHRVLQAVTPDESSQRTLQYLQLKGVLSSTPPLQVFAPLFSAFAEQKDPLWERPLFFDTQSRQVFVLGELAPPLTKLEYRLFRLLYERENEVVSKDELVEAGWPKAKGGVSDEALTAAMARLRRKIEPDTKNPRFFENVRNQGYILRTS